MEARDESHSQGSRSNPLGSQPSGSIDYRPVVGSKGVYYSPSRKKYYRKRTVKTEVWSGQDGFVDEYLELPPPPDGTAYFVGEGDFSYSNDYVKKHPNKFVKTTSYDSEETVKEYPQGKESLESMHEMPMVAVQHGVNVMLKPGSGSGAMSPRPVDMLQFNFPHTGTGSGSAPEGSREFNTFVADNQNLVRGFFRNAQHKVAPGGVVKFTYKTQGPYKAWQVEKIAGEEGWEEVHSERFVAPESYNHVLTKKAEGTVSDDGAVTITFRRKPTDAASTSLSSAVDADDLVSRLNAMVPSGSGKTEKRTSTLTTNYHKDKDDLVTGTIQKMPAFTMPGFILYKGKSSIAFFKEDIEEADKAKIRDGALVNFYIKIYGKERDKKTKAIKIKVLP